MIIRAILMSTAFFSLACQATAALILNAAMPITERVTVNLIDVANNDGTNAASVFGNVAQQAAILNNIDLIWAQAGIDIDFKFRAGTYNNTFANFGTTGANSPRPGNDLFTTISNAQAAGGVLDPNPNVLNLFLVNIVPGFSQTSANTANGISILGGNGITAWAGPNLVSFAAGQEVIASVFAHEIGHNLGLDHIVEAENLMQPGGSPNLGQRLNAAQIATAIASPFSVVVAVPEPSSTGLILVSIGIFGLKMRRRKVYMAYRIGATHLIAFRNRRSATMVEENWSHLAN